MPLAQDSEITPNSLPTNATARYTDDRINWYTVVSENISKKTPGLATVMIISPSGINPNFEYKAPTNFALGKVILKVTVHWVWKSTSLERDHVILASIHWIGSSCMPTLSPCQLKSHCGPIDLFLQSQLSALSWSILQSRVPVPSASTVCALNCHIYSHTHSIESPGVTYK